MTLVRLLAVVIARDASRKSIGITVAWALNASLLSRTRGSFANTLPLVIIVSVVRSLLQATAVLPLRTAQVIVGIR